MIEHLPIKSTKKSIFKQATYRNLYKFKLKQDNNPLYSLRDRTIFEIVKYHKYIKEEVIHTCNLEMPILNAGDLFYITELDKLVTITDSVRTSDNSYMYLCEPQYIEDEKSLDSKKVAEQDKEKHLDKTELEEELKKQEGVRRSIKADKEHEYSQRVYLERELNTIKSHWLIGRLIKKLIKQ